MKFIESLRDYKLLEIFILGIISGMPFSILGTMLSVWLTESHIPLEIITTFAIARVFYGLKFIWSPLIDWFKIPLLNKFGHRKSWLLLCTIGNSIILLIMSRLSPTHSMHILYILAIIVGFLAATFDINVDAFRIDRFEKDLQGIASANAVFGYRIGMLITGAGALYIAHITDSWSKTFLIVSLIFITAMVFILTVKENKIDRETITDVYSLRKIVVDPFKDFFSKEWSVVILLSIALFKIGDAMLGVVTMPFYLDLGFNKAQISVIVKGVGVVATILGTYCGSYIIYKLGHIKSLIITGIAQSINNATFIWLNHQGADLNALFTVISIENFCGGMGSVALVTFLSVLCNKKYSATQYALLSSCSTFANDTITMSGGTLVKHLGWDRYFGLTVVLGLPGILLLLYLNKKMKPK